MSTDHHENKNLRTVPLFLGECALAKNTVFRPPPFYLWGNQRVGHVPKRRGGGGGGIFFNTSKDGILGCVALPKKGGGGGGTGVLLRR